MYNYSGKHLKMGRAFSGDSLKSKAVENYQRNNNQNQNVNSYKY